MTLLRILKMNLTMTMYDTCYVCKIYRYTEKIFFRILNIPEVRALYKTLAVNRTTIPTIAGIFSPLAKHKSMRSKLSKEINCS